MYVLDLLPNPSSYSFACFLHFFLSVSLLEANSIFEQSIEIIASRLANEKATALGLTVLCSLNFFIPFRLSLLVDHVSLSALLSRFHSFSPSLR